jgi:alpha-beta hydrolase superfamily lysophospholipase
METPATQEMPRWRDETIVSPSLARDLRRLKRAAPFIVVLLLVIVVCLLALFGSGLVMGPQVAWKRRLAPARRFGLSPQTVSFQSADGIPLKAWWEKSWSVPVPKATVILVHGSQSNGVGMAYIAARLLPQGFSVLIPDLRAHGESGGEYSTSGYKEALDVEAAVRWVKTHVSGDRIALLGYSSGAVASLLAASRTPDLAAVIADSAYLDTTDVLRRERQYLAHPPPKAVVSLKYRLRLWLFTAPGFSWLSRGAFRLRTGVPFDPPEANVEDAVRRIDRIPVLYLAAEKDPVVPRAVTEELYRATASPHKQLSIRPGAFHSAIGGDPRGYIATVTAFLDGALGTQPVFEAAPINPELY